MSPVAKGTAVPQSEQQKIRSRLRSYERKLQQEKKKYGHYHDGAGRRYLILRDSMSAWPSVFEARSQP